jgi:hypothetical protein
VISIEQARAELLRRPRKGGTPARGVDGPMRPRLREVPAPVTLPPGEHSAVIVTDTPAARAHIDKKTVHPGEAPEQTHEKKVRVKTHFDPRRVPTQLSDKRGAMSRPGADAEMAAGGEDEVGSLWNRPSSPSDPGVPTARTSRPSLVRRPMPRDERAGAPLFVVAVMIVAALGAAVVYLLSRQKGDSGSGKPDVSVTATAQAPSTGTAPPATSAPVVATATETASASGQAPAASVTGSGTASEGPAASAPTAASTGPANTRPASSGPKPAASVAPTTTPQATATSILPFGKEEP